MSKHSSGFIHHNSNRAGFTLIEIVVSVGVLLVLGGLLISGYNGFNDSQTVTQAAKTVKSNLQLVRTNAATGVKPDGCDTLLGYLVAFPTASTYAAGAWCDVSGTPQSVGVVTTYTLPAGVTFSPIPPSVIFYALDRGASVGETITITGHTKNTTLKILTSGVVTE